MWKILGITILNLSENQRTLRNFHSINISNCLRQTNPYVTPDQVYGYKPKDKEPWDAGKIYQSINVS